MKKQEKMFSTISSNDVLERSEMKKIMGGLDDGGCQSKHCYWHATPNGGYWDVCDSSCKCPVANNDCTAGTP